MVIQPNNEGQMVIVRLVPNGPADLSGKVRPGDLLVSVDGMQVQVSCETCAVLSVECLKGAAVYFKEGDVYHIVRSPVLADED